MRYWWRCWQKAGINDRRCYLIMMVAVRSIATTALLYHRFPSSAVHLWHPPLSLFLRGPILDARVHMSYGDAAAADAQIARMTISPPHIACFAPNFATLELLRPWCLQTGAPRGHDDLAAGMR